MKTATILCAVCFCLSCSTSPPPLPAANPQKSNLTPGMVKATLKEGTTSQNEVLRVFGAPNIITMDTHSREVWTYDVQSTTYSSASTSRSGGGGLGAGAAGEAGSTIIGGGAVVGGVTSRGTNVGSTTSSTLTLMITFRGDGTVDAYRMMSTTF